MPNLFTASAAAAATLVAAGLSASDARAAFTYTSQATFTANLTSGYYQETFQSTGTGGYATPRNFAGGAGNIWKYTASTTAQAFLVFDLSGNNYLTTSGMPTTQWSAPITLAFTGAPVFAVGGSFFYTSAGGAVVGGDVFLSLSDGTSITLSGQSNTTFFGYIGTTPITSLTFTPDATHRFASIVRGGSGALS